jgi:asparaginyl-tRNA synthetase
LERVEIKDLQTTEKVGKEIQVKGWVRTKRGSKNVSFIALNDGSTIRNLQVVADGAQFSEDILKKINTGAALSVTGEVVESQGSGQAIELIAKNITVYGGADPDEYPIQPKKHSMQFLRENAHLRMRTNTMAAVMRIRHNIAFAIHQFFNDRGFFYLHTPIITSSDAEGAGEMFRVSTLDPKNPPVTEEGEVDYAQDFFGKPTNLTVSGQLEGELGAMALGKVYTFGPTFRAENSNTTRHLSEFWMIEPEVAFIELKEDMDLAEDFTLAFNVGYTDTDQDDFWEDGADTYMDYGVTLGYSTGGVDFALALIGTDLDDVEAADDRVVFSVSKSL